MKRTSLYLPLLALAVCTVVSAEPRASFIGAASVDDSSAVSLVGFFHAARGGGYGYGTAMGYGADCGCNAAVPSCGAEPTCGAGPSCGGDGNYWGGYCNGGGCGGRRHHCGLFHHHHRGNCGYMDTSCGCGVSAPSCGVEPTCGAAPSCGCDMAPACGGRHCHLKHHFGHHRLCGCGGGGCGCGCTNHAIRFWSNGWCGQMADGNYGGHPPDCMGGGMASPAGSDLKAIPQPEVAPEPMDQPAPPVPAKSTRLPLWPGFSKLPIGVGLR